ncbi:MAG: SusC/RagA family TonB-linked outer membrane protein [Gemmatimonadales bacterium]|nr:SusC/RagA family TonB-linked outer membrane protein [Gemmatimonadales bacterium]
MLFSSFGASCRGLPRRMMLGAALVALVSWQPAALTAQSNAVSGTVTDAKSGRPLAEALVRAASGSARTNAAGRFTLSGLSGASVEVTVTRIGYQPLTQTVRVGATDVALALVETALRLDEVVVTGAAAETQKRSLGNAVGQLDLAATQLAAPTQRIQEALSVAIPGLQIQRASGQLGTGAATRIRGVGSLSLASEPIIFIDGVRADNRSGSTSLGFWGADKPTRINDIDPNDIESIQVLKGPSAATLYGTEASNGVIQIITKRGSSGRAAWSVEGRGGANWLPSPEKVYEGVWYRDAANQIQYVNLIENDIARGFGSPFSTGQALGGTMSVSGGSDAVRYFFSGSYDRNEGIVSYNWMNKLNGVGNLSYSSGETFKADLNIGFTRSKVRSASATQPVTTYLVWGCPSNSCRAGSGLAPNEPGRAWLAGVLPEDFDPLEGYDEVDRSRMGLTLNHRPVSWLNHRLVIGGDFTNNPSSVYFPRGSAKFGQPGGIKQERLDRSAFITADYSANATVSVGANLVTQTSAGVQYYTKRYEQIQANGQNFPVVGVNTVSGGGVREGFENPQFNFENKTLGVYVQEQLSWKNRLFITGAVRGDDNSSFGTNFDFVVYPKVSLSWVISEEPFFANSSFLSTLKLRGAWGKAGQQPDVFAAVQTYGPSVGAGGNPTVTPLNVGNPDLKPEVSREIEAGFDASLLSDRMSLEFTYYNKVTTDGILSAPVSPSGGFPGNQFINVGQFSNKGVEVAVDGSLINGREFKLNLRGSIAKNTNKIDDLGQAVPLVQNAQLGTYHVSGFPIGGQFYKKPISAELNAAGQAINVLCEGGTNFGNGDGSAVPCATAPNLYWGPSTPTLLSSISADVQWRRFRLVGIAEFQSGQMYLDGNLAASHIFFFNSLAGAQRTDPILVAYQTGPLASQNFATGMMKGGFGKLRNVSLTYDMPRSVAGLLGAAGGSVTLTGSNLATLWRAQRGTFGGKVVDPEVKRNTGDLFIAFNQESWPQYTSFLATVRLSF